MKGQSPSETLADLVAPPDEFAAWLVTEVGIHDAEVAALIDKASHGWAVERMPVIDRAILRLATTELLLGDVPAAVAISEAVELAHRYSTDASGRFINGVLATIAAERGNSGGGGQTG